MKNQIQDIPVTSDSVASVGLKKSDCQARKGRYFFVGMAILFLILVYFGFFPSYKSLQAGTLEVHWLTHVHSAIMTSWILIFLTQALLAATGNLKFHRQLGILSIGLGMMVCLAMAAVSVHILIANHPPEGSFLFDMALTEIFELACFALFFTWGILARKKDSATHKRLLTLATFVLMTAAIDRISWLPQLGLDHPLVTFVYMDTLLIPFFIYDLVILRQVHKSTWIGSSIVIVLQFTVIMVYGSPLWHKGLFNVTTPLMEKVTEVKLSDTQTEVLLGDYESPIGKMTISRDNGTIYIQFSDGEKQELGARSDTELFLKTGIMKFYFIKGPDGRVINATAKENGRVFKLVTVKRR